MQPHEIEEAFASAETETDPKVIRLVRAGFLALCLMPSCGVLIKAAHATNPQTQVTTDASGSGRVAANN